MSDSYNPFSTFNKAFDMQQASAKDVFNAQAASSSEEQRRSLEGANQEPQPVSLPHHLFVPPSAQTLDLRRLSNVPAMTSAELIRFRAPKNMKTVLMSYALFNDALLAANTYFLPTINGNRIYPFHGDPQLDFRISLALGPDMDNAALINGLLYMEPDQELIWTFYNNSGVDVAAGVRVVGYVDNVIQRISGKFGG